jgi:hypothetical protein
MPHPDDFTRRPNDQLRRIARYQRWVIAVLFAQIALWAAYLALAAIRGEVVFEGRRVPFILTFVLGGVGGIFSFLLYWTLRGPFAAVVMGLATVVPCIGVLVLLTANSTATAALRTHGIPVGLLGAADPDIPDDRAPYDLDDDEGW